MGKLIRIQIDCTTLDAELNETETASRIYHALPIQAKIARWGDEIYFGIPVTAAREDAKRAEMAVGELAFWPPGNAFCIFWGPTPASTGQEPRAASPVVPIGKVQGDLSLLGETRDGQNVTIQRME